MSQEMYKEKARFVKKLQTFYIRDVRNIETIKRLDYLRDEKEETEFVYVTFMSGAQKRIFVSGLNEQGIFLAFAQFIKSTDDFFWLNPFEGAFREEFLEDE